MRLRMSRRRLHRRVVLSSSSSKGQDRRLRLRRPVSRRLARRSTWPTHRLVFDPRATTSSLSCPRKEKNGARAVYLSFSFPLFISSAPRLVPLRVYSPFVHTSPSSEFHSRSRNSGDCSSRSGVSVFFPPSVALALFLAVFAIGSVLTNTKTPDVHADLNQGCSLPILDSWSLFSRFRCLFESL